MGGAFYHSLASAIHWLEPGEEARLLAACRASRNQQLADIVTVALETGLRRGELLGLTWDRVNLSRGVIRLEVTKSGRRREIPMRQAVRERRRGREARRLPLPRLPAPPPGPWARARPELAGGPSVVTRGPGELDCEPTPLRRVREARRVVWNSLHAPIGSQP